MKIKILNNKLNDYVILEEETIEEIRASALVEMTKRNWKNEDCHSEEV